MKSFVIRSLHKLIYFIYMTKMYSVYSAFYKCLLFTVTEFFLLKALEGVVRAFDTYYRQLNYLLTYKLLVESRRHNVTQCGRRATQRPARRTRASINYSTTQPGRAGRPVEAGDRCPDRRAL